jgi:hypothetical protein
MDEYTYVQARTRRSTWANNKALKEGDSHVFK